MRSSCFAVRETWRQDDQDRYKVIFSQYLFQVMWKFHEVLTVVPYVELGSRRGGMPLCSLQSCKYMSFWPCGSAHDAFCAQRE